MTTTTVTSGPSRSIAPLPTKFVKWFDQIGIADLPAVGGKNASLGEMYSSLAPRGVRVPNSSSQSRILLGELD